MFSCFGQQVSGWNESLLKYALPFIFEKIYWFDYRCDALPCTCSALIHTVFFFLVLYPIPTTNALRCVHSMNTFHWGTPTQSHTNTHKYTECISVILLVDFVRSDAIQNERYKAEIFIHFCAFLFLAHCFGIGRTLCAAPKIKEYEWYKTRICFDNI